MAASTAPQPVWPKTTTRLQPKWSGVLDAAELVLVHHVAGHANDEQLADARREDSLRDHARVRARQHDGVRVLAFAKRRLAQLRRHVALRMARVQIAGVSLAQALERLICRKVARFVTHGGLPFRCVHAQLTAVGELIGAALTGLFGKQAIKPSRFEQSARLPIEPHHRRFQSRADHRKGSRTNRSTHLV